MEHFYIYSFVVVVAAIFVLIHGIVCILGISMNASKNVLLLFAADLFEFL